jgi:hypothetical protein
LKDAIDLDLKPSRVVDDEGRAGFGAIWALLASEGATPSVGVGHDHLCGDAG